MFTLHGATSGNRRLITESNFRLFVNVYHTLRFHLSEEWPRVRNRKAKDHNDDHTASDYQRDPHGKGYSQHSTPLQAQQTTPDHKSTAHLTYHSTHQYHTHTQSKSTQPPNSNTNKYLKPLLTLLTERFLESEKG